MKFHPDIPVYGDISFRGKCPTEAVEQITFFGWIRRQYSDTWGVLAIHPRNEGKRHYAQVMRQKAEGMTPGVSDIVIPGCPSCCIEMKRRDHTKSSWEDGQQEYLLAAQVQGAFVAVALGFEGAQSAFNVWLKKRLHPS